MKPRTEKEAALKQYRIFSLVLRTMTAFFFPTYQRSVALHTFPGKLPVVVL